jgi:hypothetical protein
LNWGLNIARLVVLHTVFFIPQVFAFGDLAEYLSSDGTEIHDGFSKAILADDVLAHPVWKSSDIPLTINLCNSGTNYTNANIKFVSDKDIELLEDIQAGLDAFDGISPDPAMSFNTASLDPSCSTSGIQTVQFLPEQSASLIPPGVLAVTENVTTLEGGRLYITSSTIYFNREVEFKTGDCNADNDDGLPIDSDCSTATSSNNVFSFRGVFTHELGHLLGLSHSPIVDEKSSDDVSGATPPSFPGNSFATMYQAVDNLNHTRAIESLETDDELGLQKLYPGAGFPSATQGSVSGSVKQLGNEGARGAFVNIFDTSTNRVIAGAFAGMDGRRANNDGAFTIRGIPLNTDFIIFVDPAERTGVHSLYQYFRYNTPITAALQSNLDGLKNFNIEGYPDVAVSDVKLNGNTSGAGFSNATTFRLTAGNPNLSDIHICISSSIALPNDASCTGVSLNTTNITDANPLKVTITNLNSLNLHSSPTFSLTATPDSQTALNVPLTTALTSIDWTPGLGSVNFSETSQTLTLDKTKVSMPDGGYTLTARISDPGFSNSFLVTQSFSVNVGELTGTSSGGGACSLSLKSGQSSRALFPVFLITTFLLFRMRAVRRRK